MEFIEALALVALSITGASFLIFINKSNGLTRKKSPKKTVIQETLEDQMKNIRGFYELQIEGLTKANRRLQNKVNRESKFSKDDDEEDEEQQVSLNDYEIDIQKAEPLLKQFGMNAEALKNPMLQNLIMEKIGQNAELAITLGYIRPRQNIQQVAPVSASNEQTVPAGYEALFAGNNAA